MLLHILLKEKQGKTCFLGSEHVLLVSDFNQNRFDRFIFEGDITPSYTTAHSEIEILHLEMFKHHTKGGWGISFSQCNHPDDVMISYHI